MYADEQCIAALVSIGEVDLALHNAQKAAGELPQHAELEQIAQKKRAIRQKYTQISRLYDALGKEIDRLDQELDALKERMKKAQQMINDSGNDFRAVESLTTDLKGMSEQQEEFEGRLLEAESKRQNMETLFDQIDGALKVLLSKEQATKKSLEAEVGKIKAFVEDRQKLRAQAAQNIPADILSLYQKTVKRCGGVAVCRLEGDSCSACRTTFEPGKLRMVRDEAPLAVCPACGRLMIVERVAFVSDSPCACFSPVARGSLGIGFRSSEFFVQGADRWL